MSLPRIYGLFFLDSGAAMNHFDTNPIDAVGRRRDADPVIDAYKKDIDRTLLRENLKLTPQERFLKFERFMGYVEELR
jgi:hypothetical protein